MQLIMVFANAGYKFTVLQKNSWQIMVVNLQVQATKCFCIRITGFCYSYFTVRVTKNNLLVPLFQWKGNNHPYKDDLGNNKCLG